MGKNNMNEDDFLDEFDDNSPISDQLVDQFEEGEFNEEFPDSFDESDIMDLL